MYENILKRIQEFDSIIIHRHSRPDGDAMGSQIGLREAIKTTFPEKTVLAPGDTSDRYSFCGDVDLVPDHLYPEALVFVLDTSEEYMISDRRYAQGKYIIKIDHHLTKGEFGNEQLVNTEFESCAGLVADIIFQTGMKLNSQGAKALFAGIVTDSGRFRYDSVTARTFETVAKLLKYDFPISEVYNNLYIEELKTVRLRAKFTLNFQLTPGNVAYMKNTARDIKDYESDLPTISRGMVNTMSGIKGIDIWVNFTEDETAKTVIAEIRSSKYNINEVAVKYGGGGHQLASGATLKSFAEADAMLADLDAMARTNQK
ncbi:MAG TPA: DHH family phosphoesterase [Acholeplasmatales bacterium]|nr:DHH family phosphoesterase [Acholeplasmatales bacterium]